MLKRLTLRPEMPSCYGSVILNRDPVIYVIL